MVSITINIASTTSHATRHHQLAKIEEEGSNSITYHKKENKTYLIAPRPACHLPLATRHNSTTTQQEQGQEQGQTAAAAAEHRQRNPLPKSPPRRPKRQDTNINNKKTTPFKR
jgi:hypothetical protein